MSEDTRQPAPDGADNDRRPNFARDKDAGGPEEGRRFKSKRRRKVSYLTINKIDTVDYKEVNLLRRFLNERGKILPSRQSGNTAKQQRMISSAIRRAREMALLPFVVSEMGPDRREYAGGRRERYQDRGPREERPRVEAPEVAAEAPVEAAVEPVEAVEAPIEAVEAPEAPVEAVEAAEPEAVAATAEEE